jgi:Ni,Fe-hydrogenase maturation factor
VTIVVLACGDDRRGDDGAAAAAVRLLPPEVLALAEVRVSRALDLGDLLGLPAGSCMVIVDAVAGPRPGEVVELDLAAFEAGVPSGSASPTPVGARDLAPAVMSTHQMPLPALLALVGLLREARLVGRFVGVGIASVAPGERLSHPVVAALPLVAEAVGRAVRSLAGPSTSGSSDQPRRAERDTLPP